MYRSPFTNKNHMTCDFKVKGSWAAGYRTGIYALNDGLCVSSKSSYK